MRCSSLPRATGRRVRSDSTPEAQRGVVETLVQALGLGALALALYGLPRARHLLQGRRSTARPTPRPWRPPTTRTITCTCRSCCGCTKSRASSASPRSRALSFFFTARRKPLAWAASRIGFGALHFGDARANLATLAVALCPAALVFGSVGGNSMAPTTLVFAGVVAFALSVIALRRPRLVANEATQNALGRCAPFSHSCSRSSLAPLPRLARGVHGSGLALPALLLPWLCVALGIWPRSSPRPHLLHQVAADGPGLEAKVGARETDATSAEVAGFPTRASLSRS